MYYVSVKAQSWYKQENRSSLRIMSCSIKILKTDLNLLKTLLLKDFFFTF